MHMLRYYYDLYCRSLESFILAATNINAKHSVCADYDEDSDGFNGSDANLQHVATIRSTYRTTAILEGGRKSLDAEGRTIEILYDKNIKNSVVPIGLKLRDSI